MRRNSSTENAGSIPPALPIIHSSHSGVEEGVGGVPPIEMSSDMPSPLGLKVTGGDGQPGSIPRRQSGGSEFTTGSEYGGSAVSTGNGSRKSSAGGTHRRRRSSGARGGATGFTDITRHVSSSFQLSIDIVRAISQVDQLVFCQICREYENRSSTFKLNACGHRFCRQCLTDYLEIKIKEGQVYPTCFYCDEQQVQQDRENALIPTPCAKPVNPDDIHALASSETWLRYERFKFNKENKNARSCPYCDTTELGDPGTPEMTCSKCGRKFCYFHSNAHEGKTCTEYEKITHEENLKNQALISSIAKPCPGCGSPVEKAGGCNQMKCYSCGAHFCWLCGKLVDGGTFPDHFQWWNVLGGCPNMQMQEDIAPPPPSHVRMMKILSILQVIFVGPAALLLGIAFYIICFPIFFTKWIMDKQTKVLKTHFTGCISFWGNTVVAILFIPVFLTIIALFFVFTLVQVIFSSIRARFGVCFGYEVDHGDRGGGGRQRTIARETSRGTGTIGGLLGMALPAVTVFNNASPGTSPIAPTATASASARLPTTSLQSGPVSNGEGGGGSNTSGTKKKEDADATTASKPKREAEEESPVHLTSVEVQV